MQVSSNNSPRRDHAAEMEVVLEHGISQPIQRRIKRLCAHFESMHKLRLVLAKSPPGTQAAGSLQMPSYHDRILISIRYPRVDGHVHLEAGQAPVDELNRLLRLDARDGRRRVLGDDVATV